MVPKQRPAGRTHEVRAFASIYESVASYMKNINTHRAYQPLRELRARMRSQGLPLRGEDLAEGLKRYSEQGETYVKKIQSVIRSNRLHRLTSVIFRPSPATSSERTLSAGLLSSAAQASSRYSALGKHP
jgi:Bax protein